MSILGDDDSLLGASPSGSENNYVASLGRISGKALDANLLRNGIDLAFNNDLLYLKVSPIIIGSEEDGEDGDPNYDSTLPAALAGTGIGINRDMPIYDLDINDTFKSKFVNVTNLATIDNITINANGTFGSVTGPIILETSDSNASLFFNKLLSNYLEFDDNQIRSISNQNIKLDPIGTGITRFNADTVMSGTDPLNPLSYALEVKGTGAGNITVSGNLTGVSNIIVGNEILDTVTIRPQLDQDLIPLDDLTYDFGSALIEADLKPRYWAEFNVADLSNVITVNPNSAIISNEVKIDGLANTIFGNASNIDVRLLPDTGITIIERTQWQDNTLTNLEDSPLTFVSTGIGYLRFMGTNGFVVPSGTNAEQRPSPEVGETRWNTEVGYLECYDGTVWVISTGGGETVTQQFMEDLGFVYSVVLG
jgi:hypothetical protein